MAWCFDNAGIEGADLIRGEVVAEERKVGDWEESWGSGFEAGKCWGDVFSYGLSSSGAGVDLPGLGDNKLLAPLACFTIASPSGWIWFMRLRGTG